MSKFKTWLLIFLLAISIPSQSLASLSLESDYKAADYFEIGYVFNKGVPIALVLSKMENGKLERIVAMPDNLVQRDFLGRPVRYDNYPKDETIYVKYDPSIKPEPLPKEAIEMFDKAKESQKEPELKYLPQGMIDFLNARYFKI